MVEGPAAIPAGASHGRLVISESINPTAQTVFWITLSLAVIVVVIVAADLVNRGRHRNTSLALTCMLSGLAPLLGVYAAADCGFKILAQDTVTQGALSFASIDGLRQALAALALGAAMGAIGVVLTAVLRIAPVRPPSVPAPSHLTEI